jgi:hypothetical protein
MRTPIQIAIANFVDHCQAIPTALGSPGTQTAALSVNQHALNIPYPNGITIGDSEHTDAQLCQIRQMLANSPPNTRTSVVDSYSTLDLTPLGFEVMFDTPWSYREPVQPAAGHVQTPTIETVNTPGQLVMFDRAAAVGFGQPDAGVVYSTPLLQDPRYAFYFIRQSNEIVAGVQTFTNEESLGIYTLFTHETHQLNGYANALVHRALTTAPDLPAITNPGENSEHLFSKAGFTHIGTRTI